MSRFLDSISTIISVFHQHAKEDGVYSHLSRRTMKEFIQREFADAIAKPHDPQTIDKILQFLEWDGDGEIDFSEFLLLVFRVAKACYWYLPKGPCLLQRTKLTTSGKTLQELEIMNRGSRQQLQEKDRETCESNQHPHCEPDQQQDSRVNKLETLEETGSRHQQRNTQSRNDAKRSKELREPIPHVYGERSQEPCDQRTSQGRHQPSEPDRRRYVQLCKRGSLQAHEPGLQADERRNQDESQAERVADVRSRSQTCEPQPLPNQWSRQQAHEPALPAYDQKHQRPQEAGRGRNNQPRKPELLREEKSSYQLRELEQKPLEHSSRQPWETECLDSRRTYQSYIEEPLELDHRYYESCQTERENYEQWQNEEDEVEYTESERDINQALEWEEQELSRKERERRIDRQQELDLEVYERRSRQTREREEQAATTNQRETHGRQERQSCEAEEDGRRQREPVRYERTRETAVVAAEADVKIHRVSREVEPREDVERRDTPREWERRINQQQELDLEVYERHSRQTREREDQAATTNQRETRRVERRDTPREWERRINQQQELDLEVYERHSRQTREREDQAATTNQRETRRKQERQPREPEEDGRRQREPVRYERTEETVVVAAEDDVKIHRVSRELEPHEDVERRDTPRERERRIDR
ncbi:PREDICTED: trichohyalin-like, partial [Chlamydotis macqueenii]|uniref:trichohyalin-like n=1 Tax=Chlamydotis macqueenii TaxID=187382 RepID=UPI0005296BAA